MTDTPDPVVAGEGSMIEVRRDDFSIDQIVSRMKRPEVGAIVSFLGTVKGIVGDEEVEVLSIESYQEMATKKLLELREEAIDRFGVTDVSIVHRVGKLEPTDNIVLIVVTSPNRQQAFDACRWLIEELKRTTPLWKKETTRSGERWVR